MLLTIFFLYFLASTSSCAQAGEKRAAAPEAGSAEEIEDWNSLSLAGSQLRAKPPLLGEKDDLPLFTRELLRVQWRFGDPIDLYVIRPKGLAKPPVILYLYTYPSETDRFRNDHFCIDATRSGFAAVGFVSALTGQRYKNRPMKEWFVSELQEALVKSVHDVQMVVTYLTARDDLDTSHLAMFGEGSGGTIAVLSATVDPRIKTIDLLDPWGDWPDWLAKSELIPDQERVNYTKADFLKKVAPFDPVQSLPQLKTQHVRLQQVMDDPVTPTAAKQRIEAAALATVQIVHYENTGNFFRAVSGGQLFQWMKDQITQASLPPGPSRNLQAPGVNQKASAGSD